MDRLATLAGLRHEQLHGPFAGGHITSLEAVAVGCVALAATLVPRPTHELGRLNLHRGLQHRMSGRPKVAGEIQAELAPASINSFRDGSAGDTLCPMVIAPFCQPRTTDLSTCACRVY